MARPLVLITRPAADAARTAAALAARAPDARIATLPVLRIEPVRPAAAMPHGAGHALRIVTSRHALPALDGAGPPVACVGARLAAALRAQGLVVAAVAPDATRLLRALAAAPPAGPVLYLRGSEVAADLAGGLARAGIDVEERVVYRQVPEDIAAALAARLQGEARILAPVYSARSAALLAAAWPAAAAAPEIVAISAAALAGWHGPAAAREIAARPEGGALLDALLRRLG